MRRILLSFTVLMACAGASAQDLDSITISDQFSNVGGYRGNNNGSGTSAASKPTSVSLEWEDIFTTQAGAGVSAPNGFIRYINSWAKTNTTITPNLPETPVVDATAAFNNPDRSSTATPLSIPGVAADLRTSSTSVGCIAVADDGGFNGLFFGESDDRNYWVQVDVYCENRTPAAVEYEEVSLAARAGRTDDPNIRELSYNMERAGSYAINWDTVTGKAYANKFPGGTYTTTLLNNRDASIRQTLASSAALVTGWHTFRIECENAHIRFFVDGTQIANLVDNSFANGRPGLIYRENGFASAAEHQGRFDNLHAGPQAVTITPASDWQLFQ